MAGESGREERKTQPSASATEFSLPTAVVHRQNRVCTSLQPIDDGVAVWFVCPDINLPRAPADDRRRLMASLEGVKGLDHLQTVSAENSV
jgi:hypothetical protein